MSATGRSDSRTSGLHPNDLFQTPPEAFMPLLRSGAIRLDGEIWEPCAGRGAMVRAMIEHGVDPCRIRASDLAGCRDDMPDGVALAGLYGKQDLAEVRAGVRVPVSHAKPRPDLPHLTVITNPPYKVPDADRMCGLRGDLLNGLIPKSRSTKHPETGERLRWRDGVALTFVAADSVVADQIVLGPIRISWWIGARKTRGYLRRYILSSFDARMYTLGWRPRFLDAYGAPSGDGVDSCEYGYLVLDRRAAPHPAGVSLPGVPFFELE